MSTSTNPEIQSAEEIRPDDRDLIKILSEDTTGQEQLKLKNAIIAARQEARKQLDSGVGTDEYKALTEFVQAANAAEEIVETFWTKVHVK